MSDSIGVRFKLQPIVIAIALLSSGCEVMDLDSPRVAAALNDSKRIVTVYLTANPASGFAPVYQDRVITAEPITISTVTRAEAKKSVQGVTTIIVGKSCSALKRDYSDLQECHEGVSTVRHYGEIVSKATTDREGFAVLELNAGEYRISMQTWQTTEDQKCSWSGSETLPESSRALELPVLVFCE